MGWKRIAAALIVLLGILAACRAGPTTTPAVYSLPELKYRLFSHFGDVFYCDPDFYPVPREGQEEKNALEQFTTIKADQAEFSAILGELGLPVQPDYTTEEKVRIYREHKKLSLAVEMTAAQDGYRFTLRVGEGQGYRYEGTVTAWGKIDVAKRETSFNTCPICLPQGTLIDTPGGPVPVEMMRKGMPVWTVDASGNRVAAVAVQTTATPAPPSHQVVRVTLDDGRTATASPGHPTAGGRPLGQYQTGDTLDGATVVRTERVDYQAEATYDVLPSGPTGLYWADGVLLKSTLGP